MIKKFGCKKFNIGRNRPLRLAGSCLVKATFKLALFTFAKDALRANRLLMAALLMHKNWSTASTKKSSETNIKQKMLRIQSRIAFSNGVLLENRVFLIFCFQLLGLVCWTNALMHY
jgi:hypothetical protein